MTNEEIKSAAWDALESRNDMCEQIESIADDFNYMNWIITIDSDGSIQSTSALFDLADDATVLSEDPSEFLYQMGYEWSDDSGRYVFVDEDGGCTPTNMTQHVQLSYLQI